MLVTSRKETELSKVVEEESKNPPLLLLPSVVLRNPEVFWLLLEEGRGFRMAGPNGCPLGGL
jgi:hypothetical protein